MENMKQQHEYRSGVERSVEQKIKKVVTVIFWVILGAIGISLLALLFGYVVMLLWNWLMPDIFGLGVITFWQAVGIVVLAKLLFGGVGGGGGKGRSKGRSKRLEKRLQQRCADKSVSEWRFYDRFWEEEGKQAYEAYVERKKEE